jgi:hypothetical protein
MRALLIAVLAALMLAVPASAQSTQGTWDEFQSAINAYTAWLEEWSEDLSGATSVEEQRLYWADALARSLEHSYVTAAIVWDECYVEYAREYNRRQSYINNYIAGMYFFMTAPDVEPIAADVGAFYSNTIAIMSAGLSQLYGEVTCLRMDPADFPSA